MKKSFYNLTINWRAYTILISVFLGICFLSAELFTPVCRADNSEKIEEKSIDFTSLSLEELKQVTIISILKKPQKLSEATSAISVITQEDIRRSGATNIPDLLRNVPGFQVAQINSSTWAVSARGFNHRKADKLLVLMDGRSLYTPLFSGVYWNVQDILLEDIERIEVIRGPGASLWGANAVNGVINIITKKAEDTQGGMVTSGIGNEEKRFSAFRYGNPLGDNAHGRVYIKYMERDNSIYSTGLPGNDNWDSMKGGGRIDWSFTGGITFTLQGDIYKGKNKEEITDFDHKTKTIKKLTINNDFSGGNLLGRWERSFSTTSNTTFQCYYDRTKQIENHSNNAQFTEQFDIFDLDFQHTFTDDRRQEIVWGLGYRSIHDHFEAQFSPSFSFDPKTSNMDIVSAFFQDGISIVRDKLDLTVGSKFEHNDFTGFEIQPSLRILWKLPRTQNLWASISRAVRTPTHLEYEQAQGWEVPPERKHDLQSEALIAHELGYRWRPSGDFSFDLATFYNDYTDLIVSRDFAAEAKTCGLELAATWDILKWWRLRLAYSYLHMNVTIASHADYVYDPNISQPSPSLFSPPPPFNIVMEGCNPENQVVLHSFIDLFRDLEFDLNLRYVDNLLNIDKYIEIDARLGWRPREYIELSIVGKNLLNSHHPEFESIGHLPDSSGENLEVEQSVYGKIICRF